jgi:hypothetical protein
VSIIEANNEETHSHSCLGQGEYHDHGDDEGSVKEINDDFNGSFEDNGVNNDLYGSE